MRKFEDSYLGTLAEIVSLTLFMASVFVIAGIACGVLR